MLFDRGRVGWPFHGIVQVRRRHFGYRHFRRGLNVLQIDRGCFSAHSQVKIHDRIIGRIFGRRGNCVVTIEQEVNAIIIGRTNSLIHAQINDVVAGIRLRTQIHIQSSGFVHVLRIKRQVDCSGRASNSCTLEQFVICSNLLPHDDDLVPIGALVTADRSFQTASRVNKRVGITPNEIDFAKLGQQILIFRLNFQSPVDQIGCLIIQAIGHMEIGLCDQIRLVKVNSSFATKGIFQRTGNAAGVRRLSNGGNFNGVIAQGPDRRILLHNNERLFVSGGSSYSLGRGHQIVA